MQRVTRDHAADVLYELPDSRVGSNFLQLASFALHRLCLVRPSTAANWTLDGAVYQNAAFVSRV